ncbi:protein kinase, putative [Trypanosoma brucei gambiense DAL972]|uniref:non-specific serine/threonine protein kinase n=1 Tax=Trypanosoma brucei gambiense (strain MHOM/CI/86/DAL972) TaxID=679716 RepID=C9ZJ37_TRYB9|nr:protein kinase, putative [Trypanosoma brucei gambiense DAL972]CBH09395.1 protein kinase, putative [Trypanosoma brucei gambiense DAL972]|eukprot:XP_011771701.1 protein kinase, putative [Trypanosoma brucei gambiense DAL972]
MPFAANVVQNTNDHSHTGDKGNEGTIVKVGEGVSLQSSTLDIVKSVGEGSAAGEAPGTSFRTIAAGAMGSRAKGAWEVTSTSGKPTTSSEKGDTAGFAESPGNNPNFLRSPLQRVLVPKTSSRGTNRLDGRNPLGEGAVRKDGDKSSGSCVKPSVNGDNKCDTIGSLARRAPPGLTMGRSELGSARDEWPVQSPRGVWPHPALSGKSSPNFYGSPVNTSTRAPFFSPLPAASLPPNNTVPGTLKRQLYNVDTANEEMMMPNNSFASTIVTSGSRCDNRDPAFSDCGEAGIFTPKRVGRDSRSATPTRWYNTSFHGNYAGGPMRRTSTAERGKLSAANEQNGERREVQSATVSPGLGLTTVEVYDTSISSRTGNAMKEQRSLSPNVQPACFYPINWSSCPSRDNDDSNAGDRISVPGAVLVPVDSDATNRDPQEGAPTNSCQLHNHCLNRTNSEWWFKDPTIFLLNVNLIKLLELREEMERLNEQRSVDRPHSAYERRGREASLHSSHSIMLAGMLEKLESIQFQIAYSILDIKNVLLKHHFAKWSNTGVRDCVSNVVSAWDAHGPASKEFKEASYILLDLVSAEERGSITYTNVHRMWNALGTSRTASCAATAFCFVSLLCFVVVAAAGTLPGWVCAAVASIGALLMVSVVTITSVQLHYSSVSARVWGFSHNEMLKRVEAVQQNLYDGGEGATGVPVGYSDLVAVQKAPGSSSTCFQLGKTSSQGHMLPQQDAPRDDCARDCGPLSSRNSFYSRSQLRIPNDTTGILRKVPSMSNVKCSSGASNGAISSGRSEKQAGSLRDSSPCLRRADRQENDWWNQPAGGRWNDDSFNRCSPMERVPVGHADNPLVAGGSGREWQEALSEQKRECDTAVRKQIGRRQSVDGDRAAANVLAVPSEFNHGEERPRQFRGAQRPQSRGVDSEVERMLRDAASKAALNSAYVAPMNIFSDEASPGSSLLLTSATGMQGNLLGTGSDGLPITAFVYCLDDVVASTLLANLWNRSIYVMQRNGLEDIDMTYKSCAVQTKVILVHAPDVDGAHLDVVLSWMKGGERLVFFFASSSEFIPSCIPKASQLVLPLTSHDIGRLFSSSLTDEMASKSLFGLSRNLQIPSYTLGRRLGGGAFGAVFEATMDDLNGRCAVKVMCLRGNKRDNGARNNGKGVRMPEVVREIEVMRMLNHPNLVRYLFCNWDGKCVSIFMELCPGGTLSDAITNGDIQGADHIISILRDVINGVVYLHDHHITHRDLKPENILFRDGRAKVSDFGTAVQRDSGLKNTRGTLAYMAPEVLLGEPYGKACDVWSIGCIVAEALGISTNCSNKCAAQDAQQQKQQRPVTDQQFSPTNQGLAELCERYRTMDERETRVFDCDDPTVCDFLQHCLHRNPEKRPSPKELLEHPLLNARCGSAVWEWVESVIARQRAMPLRRRTSTVILTSVAVNKGAGIGRDDDTDGADGMGGGEGGGLHTTYISRVASMSAASLQSISEEGQNSASWGTSFGDQGVV